MCVKSADCADDKEIGTALNCLRDIPIYHIILC